MVEIAFTGAQEYVAHMRLYFLCEGTIASHTQLQIRTIIAHHIHQSFGQFITILLIHPSLHGLQYLGTFEGHDMVPSSCISSAGTEIAPVMESLKGHSEVVPVAVHRVFEVLHGPLSCAVAKGLEDVQSAHAGMSITGEVQFPIGAEGGEHLVARGVDRFSHVLGSSQSVFGERYSPYVQSTHPSGHVAYEVYPLPIGTHGRMSITGECVLAYL